MPDPALDELCEPGQLIQPLLASVFSFKMVQKHYLIQYYCRIVEIKGLKLSISINVLGIPGERAPLPRGVRVGMTIWVQWSGVILEVNHVGRAVARRTPDDEEQWCREGRPGALEKKHRDTCDLQRAPGPSREAENGGYGDEKRVKKHPGQSPASHCGLGEAGIYNSRTTFSMH